MKSYKARLIWVAMSALASGVLCAFPEKPTYPEIQLAAGFSSIPNNSVSPTTLAGTDFGVIDSSVSPRIHTIQVHNLGENDLLLSPTVTLSGANAAEFYIHSHPGLTTVPAGGQTSFQVAYSPSFASTHNATIELLNNDSDEGVYQFAIRGTLSEFPLPKQVSIDPLWVGYGTYKALGYPQVVARTTGGIGFLNNGNKFMRGCRLNVYVSNVPFLDETSVRVFSRVSSNWVDFPRQFSFGNYGIVPFATFVPINHQYLIGEIITSPADGELDYGNNRFMYKFTREQ